MKTATQKTELSYLEQANKFLADTSTDFKYKFLKNAKYFDGDEHTRDIYTITLKRGQRAYSFTFGQSINNSGKARIAPSTYDVLSCLTKYDPNTFEDFCSEFGYNTDSRKAEKVYKSVCDEWANLQSLFNDAELEILREIN